jgi:hypothetical protein
MSIETGAGDLFVNGEFVGDIINVRLTKPEPAPMTTMPDGSPIVSVDAKGRVVGDTSAIDPHILEQLADPGTQAQIRALYRDNRYGKKEEAKPPRYLNDGARRDFSHMRPAGMSAKDFKRYRKTYTRKMTKAAIKMHAAQRSNRGN